MDFITIIISLCRSIYITMCMSFIGEKFTNNTSKYFLIGFLFFIMTTLATHIFPSYVNSKFEPYFVIALVILLYLLFFKTTLYNSTFYFFFAYLITVIFQMIILIVYSLFNITMQDMMDNSLLVLYMETAMLILVIALSYFDLFRKFTSKIETIAPYLVTIVLNLFIFLQIVRITTDWLTNQKDVNYIYTYLLFFILLVINLLMMKHVIKSQKEKSEMKSYLDYEKMIIPLIENSRAAEHDFKNHLLTLKAMTKNPTEEFSQYIRNITDEVEVDSVYKLCNNPVVGALLQEKLRYANENNIQAKFEISDKEKLPENLKPHHLITVLSNLIDNAFEEAIKPTCVNKEVSISIIQSDRIIISIKNNLAADTFYDFNRIKHDHKYSTKGITRGYGTKNIKKIVKEYNGDLEIYHLENAVEIKVNLYP